MIRGSGIDLGTEAIETVRQPGEVLSYRDIAEICTAAGDGVKVTHQDIWYIEQRAIGKMIAEVERRRKASARKAVAA